MLPRSWEVNRSVRKPSRPRERTAASSSPSPKNTRSPTCILRPGRTSTSQVSESISRVRKISTLPVRCSALVARSEEHTSELQSRLHLVCRLLLEKKKKKKYSTSALPQHTYYALYIYHHS